MISFSYRRRPDGMNFRDNNKNRISDRVCLVFFFLSVCLFVEPFHLLNTRSDSKLPGCLDFGAQSIIWRRRRRTASRASLFGGLQTGVSPCHQIVATIKKNNVKRRRATYRTSGDFYWTTPRELSAAVSFYCSGRNRTARPSRTGRSPPSERSARPVATLRGI